ncbi:glycosyl hydrolase family 65 protein [Kitasatospora paracochleata]|uniref:Alpha,alpha-trehalose phosphorylase n=1 Tax=Kitasatospora paracochleata TaxID=58354 RepID=A0ABT1J3C9_9ACTN|nr:glycosyl hydrolase family 65 protein [Kitasatospora paracochleata]MCP2311935.1 alpha,alpha-trehalose phosphorylase [Kitasatospora paracochleata]
MISHDAYAVEPWCLREERLDLAVLPQSESLFALSNGHLGWRGTLDEGEPHGLPGSYLNGVYESVPLTTAEPVFGLPRTEQSVVNVTNGRVIRLLVDDQPFDLRYGRLHGHRRTLDLRTGVLERVVEWSAPSGRTVRVRSWRLVSLTQRAIGAVAYEVEPVDGTSRVVLQSELLANEQLPGDPPPALAGEEHAADGTRLRLVHRTRHSGQRLAVAAEHTVTGDGHPVLAAESTPDLARLTVTAELRPGQVLRLEKLVAHGWSAVRTLPAVRGQVDAALAAAQDAGWSGLLAEQREFLDAFWARADVELDGDPEIQQAVRFALFQVEQAAARAEERAVAAKGLTGSGLDGHCFWDSETFVLQVLTYTSPGAVAQALRWRHRTLPAARRRAHRLGLAGAAFPWSTIDGEDCAGYWPAGLASFHLNADIADAVVRYTSATDDLLFDREAGLELLVHTARLWRSLGHHDRDGAFHLDGVTGPDAYSALADDNVYTNLMAQQNLRAAADAAERNADLAVALGVSDEEIAAWREAALHLALPYDEVLDVHQQAAGFTRHEPWDFGATPPEEYPLAEHHPYFQLYRKQVVEQADLVLAMQLRGEAFSPAEKARNFAYYEALTVRDSALSAAGQAVLAAEVGHLRLAYDYLTESALMDLDDLRRDTRDGLHLAALAGTWIALVAGFGGMRHHGDTLAFAPRLPDLLDRLAFTIQFQRRSLRVEITAAEAEYRLDEGPELELWHHGEALTVPPHRAVRRPVPPAPELPEPAQPPGRRPRRRPEPDAPEASDVPEVSDAPHESDAPHASDAPHESAPDEE